MSAVRASAGFAYDWIEWDGVEGSRERAGRVAVDGIAVPVYATACNVVGEHDHDATVARGELCRSTRFPEQAYGFSWWLPLENGAWACMHIDHDSSTVMAWECNIDEPGNEYGRVLHVANGTLTAHADCLGGWCPGCWHRGDLYDFESRDELMEILDTLARLPLDIPTQEATR